MAGGHITRRIADGAKEFLNGDYVRSVGKPPDDLIKVAGTKHLAGCKQYWTGHCGNLCVRPMSNGGRISAEMN